MKFNKLVTSKMAKRPIKNLIMRPFFFLCLCLAPSYSSLSAILPVATLQDTKLNLTKDQLSLIAKGELFLATKHINGAPWPQVIIYGKMKATPLQAIAIYLALDQQYRYVPNMTKSQVIAQTSPTRVITQYEMDLPFPLPNAKYTHGSDFEKLSHNRGLHAHWWMIKSNSTKEVRGSITFYNEGVGTFFVYKNFVRPKSFFGRFFKGKMLKDTRKTIEAIQQYIQDSVIKRPLLLKKYIGHIQNSLKGNYVYFPK